MSRFSGILFECKDMIQGEDKNRQGVIYVLHISDIPMTFVCWEMKTFWKDAYTQSVNGVPVVISFSPTKSPKYGDVHLIEKISIGGKVTNCAERRILIHKGQDFTWSANCLIPVSRKLEGKVENLVHDFSDSVASKKWLITKDNSELLARELLSKFPTFDLEILPGKG